MRIVVALAAVVGALFADDSAASFVTFESGQVRPLALTPDGRTLLALNTPDARLEIFDVVGGALTHRAAVLVGLEPVAVAARSNTEIWVANLLSDSISIVDIAATPRVVRTLLVGDEPRDIVFAGPAGTGGRRRAFITTARLGQNLPLPMALTTPGTPRALVWVFDAENLGSELGGTPLTIVELFGDTPRALAASADGSTVYAAVFQSGNQTTTVTDTAVCDGGAAAPACDIDGVQVSGGLANGQAPGGVPPPNENMESIAAPEVGIIVKLNRDSGVWEDELGRNWNNGVRFNLPDLDVFRVDALANPPRQTASFAHVGTVLFNMIVDPANGRVYVSTTEARNEIRFEGHGDHSPTTLRGHLHETRIAILDGTTVRSRHLNKHITALPQGYKTSPMPPGVKTASLATPVDMALASDGTLYVAAFGSSKVGVFNTTELVDDTFVPDASRLIAVSGGGPSGLALDEAEGRLYVLTRFDNAVKVIDTATRAEIAQHPLHNPEPEEVVAGRPFLYDAVATSSNGEASCAVCHVFGDLDSLAWDLGDPDEVEKPNPNPLGPTGSPVPFHPMKGPMATQTLRGMKQQGPMHWRGDRTGGEFFDDPRALDTDLAFKAFNAAFDPLNGRDEGEIADEDMQVFTDFILQVQPPPNPVRSLDNQLNPVQDSARRLFLDRRRDTDAAAHCSGCHTFDAGRGFFGTLGQAAFTEEAQQFKVPQLKNLYQKVGMFGMPRTQYFLVLPEHAQHQGDQIRGFGFLHDGSVATVFDFLRNKTFTLTDDERRGLEQFIFAFDTTFAPIVGQQVTLAAGNADVVGPRIDLMIARARTPFVLVGQSGARECDLVARAVIDGQARSFLMDPVSGTFQSDRAGEAGWTDTEIRALASAVGQEVTYTCVPPSEGTRLGLDRDGDGVFDRDEIDSGTDPTDPAVHPTVSDFFTPTRTVTPTITPSATPTPTATETERPTRTPSVTPTLRLIGDADCNRIVDRTDETATCVAVFDAERRADCDADCNADGRVSAADTICVVQQVAAVR